MKTEIRYSTKRLLQPLKIVLFFTAGFYCGVTQDDVSAAEHQTDTGGLDRFEEIMYDGLDAFYQTDWKMAAEYFATLQKLEPDNPRGYFFSAMIPFWEYFFVDQNEDTAQNFMDAADVAIAKAEKKYKKNPDDVRLISMLSGLYGYKSLVASGENNVRTAIRNGRDGFNYTQLLLDRDETMPEIYIGRGMYHYMVGSVPRGLRWLVRLFGLNGDTHKGFAELKKAAASEGYIRADAKMILAYLFNKEGEHEKAIDYLEELIDEFPRNQIFHFVYAETLESMGKETEAILAYNAVLHLNDDSSISGLHDMIKKRMSDMKSSRS